MVAGRPIDETGPNIHYLGYRSDIEDVYRAVDFTILASTYEPFGLVGVESVLCGTPVLVADGRDDIIDPPQNSSLIAAQIPFAWLAFYEGGHAFLYQSAEKFGGTVNLFLSK